MTRLLSEASGDGGRRGHGARKRSNVYARAAFLETKALYREVRIIHAAREEERSPRVLTGIKTNSDQ